MLNYKKYNEYSAVHYTFYDEHYKLDVFLGIELLL